jgi:hypothetical protein
MPVAREFVLFHVPTQRSFWDKVVERANAMGFGQVLVATPTFSGGPAIYQNFTLSQFFLLVILGLLGWGLIEVIRFIGNKTNSTATPANISSTITTQKILLDKRLIGVTQGKKGLSTAFANVPEDQRRLINTSVLGVRLMGTLGSFEKPVFKEDDAVRYALASGARCLILEIDREENSFEPKLIYRDTYGYKQSLNTGSIELVARNLAGRAFTPSSDGTPSNVARDPLILVLYFVSTPSPSETPKDYVRFLAKVAAALQPIAPLVLGQTPQGDFRRQAQESQLFYQPISVLEGRMIVLTNADTTPFRILRDIGLAGEIDAKSDLDLLCHARLYSKESPSNFGITGVPADTKQPAAVITSFNYWLQTPPDRLQDAVSQTKKAWTLVMAPVAYQGTPPNKDQLSLLLTRYGVQCVPIVLFDEDPKFDLFCGTKGTYRTASWIAKPQLIRFIPPKPIPINKPMPQADAGGGAMRTPAF